MAKGTFGEQLKREREMRGVTLDEIAAATRIAPRFLRAIEDEQWDQLPGGVFNRGFVRAMAHYLGLDEESIVAEYGLVAGVRPSVPVWTGSPPAVAPSQPWLAWFLAALMAIALLFGGWFGFKSYAAWRARHTEHSPISVDSPASVIEVPPRIPSAMGAAPVASAALRTAPGGKRTEISAHHESLLFARDAGALQMQLNGTLLFPIAPSDRTAAVTPARYNLSPVSGDAN